ncbi:MAG TPA: hypothetical protein VGS97_28105, partial [Actinocrinis sp.]|uniref:hypothetical protein n=1 Tax=Actinocrinis sp. TaxID=1920516 RepID=UPI002DDC93D0
MWGAIAAPDHVHASVKSVYESLQTLRDLLAYSATLTRDSSEYGELNTAFRSRLRALEIVMRDDLKPALHSRP